MPWRACSTESVRWALSDARMPRGWDRTAGPVGAAVPVPVRVTVVKRPGASLVRFSEAFRAPVALGAKRTKVA